MGVPSTFILLDRRGLQGTPVKPALSANHIDVDLASLFYGYITNTHDNMVLAYFRQNTQQDEHPTATEVRMSLVEKLASALNSKLRRSFNRNITIHFDGTPSAQKSKAHAARAKEYKNNHKRSKRAIRRATVLLDLQPRDQVATKGAIKKILRLYNAALQAWRSEKLYDSETKNALADMLEHKYQWQVCYCKHEADCCISSLDEPDLTVATTDSDFLFLPVDTVLRQDPQDRSQFLRLDRQEVLNTLDVNEDLWTSVAITSGNDFSKNIPGYGINRNLKFFKVLPDAKGCDIRDFMGAYKTAMSHKTGTSYDDLDQQFSAARDIYFLQYETSAGPTSTPNRSDEALWTLIQSVNEFFRNNRKQKKMKRKGKSSDTTVAASSTFSGQDQDSASTSSHPDNSDVALVTTLVTASTADIVEQDEDSQCTANKQHQTSHKGRPMLSFRDLGANHKFRAHQYEAPTPTTTDNTTEPSASMELDGIVEDEAADTGADSEDEGSSSSSYESNIDSDSSDESDSASSLSDESDETSDEFKRSESESDYCGSDTSSEEDEDWYFDEFTGGTKVIKSEDHSHASEDNFKSKNESADGSLTQAQQSFIPDNLVDSVIGKGGSDISEMCLVSGLHIENSEPLTHGSTSNEHLVAIAGAPELNQMDADMDGTGSEEDASNRGSIQSMDINSGQVIAAGEHTDFEDVDSVSSSSYGSETEDERPKKTSKKRKKKRQMKARKEKQKFNPASRAVRSGFADHTMKSSKQAEPEDGSCQGTESGSTENSGEVDVSLGKGSVDVEMVDAASPSVGRLNDAGSSGTRSSSGSDDPPPAGDSVEGETKEKGTPKSVAPTRMINEALKSKHMMGPLHIGTVRARINASIAGNLGCDKDDILEIDKSGLPKTVTDIIKTMVSVAQDATRGAQQLIAHHILSTFESHPGLAESDVAYRKLELANYTSSRNKQGFQASQTFFRCLVTDVYLWHHRSKPRKGRPRAVTNSTTVLTRAVEAFDNFLQRIGVSMPDLKGRAEGLTLFLQLVADRIMDEVQTHFQRNITELVSWIRHYDDHWSTTADGTHILNSIDLDTGQSTLVNNVSLFFMLNVRLPAHYRMAFFPESGYHDANYNISELALITALYANANKESLQPLKNVLGTTTMDATTFLSAHPGELTYILFFNPSLGYDKYTSVASRHLTLEVLEGRRILKIPTEHKDRYNMLKRRLKRHPNDPKKKRRFRHFLKAILKSPAQHKHAIDAGHSRIHYVLSGTLQTNGHIVNPLAYCLTKAKPPKTSVPNSTRYILRDVRKVFTSPQAVQDTLPYNNGLYQVTGVDPGIHCTATSTTIYNRNVSKQENVSVPRTAHTYPSTQYQKWLERAKKMTMFKISTASLGRKGSITEPGRAESGDIQETFEDVTLGQDDMDIDSGLVVGDLDMEEGPIVNHDEQPPDDQVDTPASETDHGLPVSTVSIVELPDASNELQKMTIHDLEATLTSVDSGNSSGALDSIFKTLAESTKQHLASVLLVQGNLCSFYGSDLFKIRGTHLKQAQRAAMDKGVSRICVTAGLGTKIPQGKSQPVIVVGDGCFGCSRGPSLYMQFIKFMKKKVVSLNGRIFCAPEFHTSLYCCQCKVEGVLVGRNLECESCGMTRDRDHNAASNIAQAAISQLEHQSWPNYLQRPL
ncbi:hypothetical protein BGZ59_011022 [Podila verticillata]|nr:hypothetical protein BGZ59_011022 [Podila verticillata]